jgi:hypothetical protein
VVAQGPLMKPPSLQKDPPEPSREQEGLLQKEQTEISVLHAVAHVPLLSVTVPVTHGKLHTPLVQRPLQH